MGQLFISHSSSDSATAVALSVWLEENGYADLFLDVDPLSGIVPGQQWQDALRKATDRCEAVLFLVSPSWIHSHWCRAEFLLAKNLQKRIFGLIIEPVAINDIPTEMTAEWQLCHLCGEGAQRQFDVAVKGQPASVTLSENGLALLRRGLEKAGLDPSSFPWPPPEEPNRAAYRGLVALEPSDAAIFFGRDAAIVRGIDTIRGLVEREVERTLIVLGASGSGKSSFLRAGLWPRLARADTAFLPLPIIRPEAAPVSGAAGLAVSLAGAFARIGTPRPLGRIRAALTAGSDPLGTLLDELLVLARARLADAEGASPPAIIIPIDQAEELFNPEAVTESAQLFALLREALGSEAGLRRRLLIVATMRSDRYELLQAGDQLADVKRALFDLSPLPATEFKSVIEGPAERISAVGRRFTIDPALTEQLIKDSSGADALPLLAFTLERLYADFGQEDRLTMEHYRQIGFVQGAIEAAVDRALSQPGRQPVIPPARDGQFAALRAALIPWLARFDADSGLPLRRVALWDEMPEESRAVVERLVEARLLVADRRDGHDVVEVAHESLLRQWPALTAWLDADRDDLKLVEGVDRAAREWDGNGRQNSWLDHRAERLAAAHALTTRPDFARRIGPVGMDYLAACRAQEEAARRRQEEELSLEATRLQQIAAGQARIRKVLFAFAGVLVAGLAASGWFFVQLQQRGAALNREQVSLLAGVAATQRLSGNVDGAIRLAITDVNLAGSRTGPATLAAHSELAASTFQSGWRLALSGHTGAVTSVAYSPDGTRLVTGSSDGTAREWDAASGRAMLAVRREGHQAAVTAVAFSPDGSAFLTASDDGTAGLWSASDGAVIRTIQAQPGGVTSAAFSPDGKRVVTAGHDSTARVWDVATGTQLLVLGEVQKHPGPVWQASFRSDGARILTASEDGTAEIWDASTGAELLELKGKHAGGVWTAAFSPDGSKVVTGGYDNFGFVWDAASGTCLGRLNGHQDWITAVNWSPDGTEIITASQDNTARLWNAAPDSQSQTGAALPDLSSLAVLAGHEGGLLDATISPDGRSIATASFDRTARIWDTASAKPVVFKSHTDKIWNAAFSPDAKLLVTASQDGRALIWDVASKTILQTLPHPSWVLYAEFSPDGKRVVTASQDDIARLWDVATGEELRAFKGHEGGVLMAEFDPSGARIVTASFDGTSRIWDVATGQELLKLQGHESGVLTAAFSPDGATVVTGGYDDTARLWNSHTGALLATWRGHTGGVWDAHFSPDGKRVVTASEDHTAREWDVATGRELTVLSGHSDWVWSAMFNKDGTQIVTGSQDHTARVWNAADGIEIGVIREIVGGIYFAEFSPDGTEVLTASDDYLAQIWPAHFSEEPSANLVNDICIGRLGGISSLTRDEMRLAGYPDTMALIDVCAK